MCDIDAKSSPEVDAQPKAMPDRDAAQQKRLMVRELLKGKGPVRVLVFSRAAKGEQLWCSPLWLLLAVAKLPVGPSEHILHLRQVEGREAHRVRGPCDRENKRGRFSAIDLHRKQGVVAIA